MALTVTDRPFSSEHCTTAVSDFRQTDGRNARTIPMISICTVSRQPGGVPGDGVNRDDRAVHLVRSADPVPCDAGAQALRAGALQSGSLRRARRLRRRALGGHHHRALLAARHVPGHQGHAQLHASRCRWPLHPRADVVGLQRQALVQGTHHESGRVNEPKGYSAAVGTTRHSAN
jgi:hypothetical protein